MIISKSVLFQAAHTRAKQVHKKGDNYAVTFGAALKIVYAEMKNHNITLAKPSKKEVKLNSKAVRIEKKIVLNGLKEALKDDGDFKTGDDVSTYNVTFIQLLEYTGLTGSCQLATLKELKKQGIIDLYKTRTGFNIYLRKIQ